ncbi:MAG: CapA family protein [Clostridia bacterium]|nr:CapA family protein [Clostridia bacterium]
MENNKKKKSSLIRNLKRAITLLLCVVLIVGCINTLKSKHAEKAAEAAAKTSQSVTTKTGKTSANLICAGDNLIHQAILDQAKQRSTTGGYDFSAPYQKIAGIVKDADVAFLNQEVAIVPSQPASSYPLFNSPPELLDQMITLGFDVYNQSTNHIMDKFLSGALEDYELFHSKKDIILTGLYKTWDDMFKPEVIEKNDIKFSFCGFTQYLNGLIVPADSDLGLVYLTDERHSQEELYQTMEKVIKVNKEASDICCVSMHWMQEDITTPNDSQRQIAQKLVDYGADIIIGTGPHVLQPIEYLTREDGSKALVIWSLGNLISTQANFENTLGGLADVTVEKSYDTGAISISNVGFIPTVTHYEYGKSNVRIIPFAEYSQELAAAHGSGNLSYDKIKEYYTNMYGDFLRLDAPKENKQ